MPAFGVSNFHEGGHRRWTLLDHAHNSRGQSKTAVGRQQHFLFKSSVRNNKIVFLRELEKKTPGARDDKTNGRTVTSGRKKGWNGVAGVTTGRLFHSDVCVRPSGFDGNNPRKTERRGERTLEILVHSESLLYFITESDASGLWISSEQEMLLELKYFSDLIQLI